MLLRVNKSTIGGRVRVPGSKSHTIRAMFLAGLSDGVSRIDNPLVSSDALSAVEVCRMLGAGIEEKAGSYVIKGVNGMPSVAEDIINVGNSGTTLRFGVMTAALAEGYTVFTGDYQIRRRPLGPLLEAINGLGGHAFSVRNNGSAPAVIRGRASGGRINLDSVTSQYLSSILINAPVFEKDTEIEVIRLNEVPYIDITMWWLNNLGISYQNDNYKFFTIKGGQKYKPFNMSIPGDFSSATFFMVLAAISGGEIILENLDLTDPQGDKEVLSILRDMGAKISTSNGLITVKGQGLNGMEIDMNAIPDALPAMAVAGCYAEGETRLVNVPQARLKETDRIHVMCEELGKMGADIEELPDGLIIRNSKLRGAKVKGHDDHRVVMALAVAGLLSEGETLIDTAEAMNVTFPEFVEFINNCGGNTELIDERG